MRAIFLTILIPLLYSDNVSVLDRKIAAVVKTMPCAVPDDEQPVTLNAKLVSDKDSIAVIVLARIAPGWHIYDYVPENMPFIQSDCVLKLPDNLKPVGEWIKSESFASVTDKGVLIFENKAVFVHKAVRVAHGTSDGVLEAGLYYQTCNLRQCIPPIEKTIRLKY